MEVTITGVATLTARLSGATSATIENRAIVNATLSKVLRTALYGMDFPLGDRQPITQRQGIQGMSFPLGDRQPITQRQGLQGISFVLGNSQVQVFDFQHGFDAVNIEFNDDQWFETQYGMDGVDVELDNPTGRGYIIRK